LFQLYFEGVAPVVAVFKDESTGTVNSWLWNFGEGNTSLEQNPEHFYNATENYTVTLTTTGSLGTDVYTQHVYVKELIINYFFL